MLGVVFASYGTSSDEARRTSSDVVRDQVFAGVSQAVRNHGIEEPCMVEAWTSARARAALEARARHVPSPSEALRGLAQSGATQVLVQPGHLVEGGSLEGLRREVAACSSVFCGVSVGEPLLGSQRDAQRVARAVGLRYPSCSGEALVLVGHGVAGLPSDPYQAVAEHLHALGRDDVFVGTLQAPPHLADVRRLLARGRLRRVRLVPLMLSAAGHVGRDIMGPGPDSWASLLRSDGYVVSCEHVGLGELADVRELFVEHALAALDKLVL